MARQMTASDGTVSAALKLIMDIQDVSDSTLAKKVGMSVSMIQKRRNGKPRPIPLSGGEIDVFAAALGVPIYLFHEDRATILRWFADRAEGERTKIVRQRVSGKTAGSRRAADLAA